VSIAVLPFHRPYMSVTARCSVGFAGCCPGGPLGINELVTGIGRHRPSDGGHSLVSKISIFCRYLAGLAFAVGCADAGLPWVDTLT